MTSPLSNPDHNWEVRFSTDGSKWKAKFKEICRNKKKLLNLNDIDIQDGDIIQLNSIGHNFAAHWHKSSTADLVDQTICGHPSVGDDKDDLKKWRGLDIASDENFQNNKIQFAVKKKALNKSKRCESFLQLRYRPSVPKTRKGKDKKQDHFKMTKIPTNDMIIRITINVS